MVRTKEEAIKFLLSVIGGEVPSPKVYANTSIICGWSEGKQVCIYLDDIPEDDIRIGDISYTDDMQEDEIHFIFFHADGTTEEKTLTFEL